MKCEYKSCKFQQSSLERIRLCNDIIEDYQGQGLKLTLRQLYYQLVSKNVVPNTEKSYKSLGRLVSDARLAGLMDWDAIEDRNRTPVIWTEYANVKELVESMLDYWRMPRWEGQDNYVELWVEKAALAGVLRPLASEFHVTLMVNRGYSSQSAMYESAQRFIEKTQDGQRPILFYLGDHDPSGEDMVRDISDRLHMFGVPADVRKLALTMEQVKEYDPPPNPAKMSDSRAHGYVQKHGADSWEVDALNPVTLARIIREAFEEVVDRELMDEVIAKEEREEKKLKRAVARLVKDTTDDDADEG